MPDFDVIVIGGGPAGYAAALKAADLGASVALIEAEKPGGACVHHACIPTNIMVDAAIRHLEARELGVLGIFDVGEQFNFARAAARKEFLVKQMADGIRTALKMRRVTTIEGRGEFVSESALKIAGSAGVSELRADAFVIATGTRWEPPTITGLAPERILTADAVQALAVAPKSALVLVDGPGEVPFGLEYAVLLAVAGTEVSVATAHPRLLPALDATIVSAARAGLSDLGIAIHEGASLTGAEGDELLLTQAGTVTRVAAEVVVAADVRVPYFATLGLAAAGVVATNRILVDRSCRTNVGHIFAAGDVTGGAMLSSAASQMGDVAGTNATGGESTTRLGALPRLLHTVPGIGWIGMTEEKARADGYDVVAGVFDLSYNARAITLGARTGVVKVVAERELGEILGVHAVGPECGELLAVASSLIQAEVTVHDLAGSTAWHPSISEGLIEAARRCLG